MRKKIKNDYFETVFNIERDLYLQIKCSCVQNNSSVCYFSIRIASDSNTNEMDVLTQEFFLSIVKKGAFGRLSLSESESLDTIKSYLKKIVAGRLFKITEEMSMLLAS